MSRKSDMERLPDPDMSDVDLFEFLSVPLQQKVARGELDLDVLMELLTRPDAEELCPHCACSTIDPRSPLGLCKPCTQRRSTDAAMQVVTELQSLRDNNALKKQKQRLRDELDPDRVRRPGPRSKAAADYGRSFLNTVEPLPLVHCEICGRIIRQHADDQVRCTECES